LREIDGIGLTMDSIRVYCMLYRGIAPRGREKDMERNQAEKALAEALGAVAVSAGSITAATYGIAKVCLQFLG